MEEMCVYDNDSFLKERREIGNMSHEIRAGDTV